MLKFVKQRLKNQNRCRPKDNDKINQLKKLCESFLSQIDDNPDNTGVWQAYYKVQNQLKDALKSKAAELKIKLKRSGLHGG